MQDQAFYNEIDKDAAAWLRELIAEGEIAPGIVDERSIEDVRPDELAGFTQCHFFAGIGIWSLALRAAGVPDSYPIWSGSCPCQPFSSAGKGDGFDDERHLWPAFHHLISQRRPPAVLGEQVASKDAMPWIDLVHTDLEALGYAFGAIPFPTAGIGGPHIRDRLYWGAFSAGVTQGDTGSKGLQGHRGYGYHEHKPGWLGAIEVGPVAAAGELGRLADDMHSNGRYQAGQHIATTRGDGASGDSSTGGLGHTHSQRAGWDGRAVSGEITRQDRQHRQHLPIDAHASGGNGGLANTGRVDHRGQVEAANYGKPQTNGPTDQSGGRCDTPSGLAVPGSERHNGRGAAGAAVSGRLDAQGHPSPANGLANSTGVGWPSNSGPFARVFTGSHADISDRGSTVRPGPVNGFWRDADWLFCRDGKWRPVEPGTQPLAYGMPRSLGDLSPELQRLAAVAGLSKASLKRAKQFRVGGLRAYGNAINAIAAQAFIESLMGTT